MKKFMLFALAALFAEADDGMSKDVANRGLLSSLMNPYSSNEDKPTNEDPSDTATDDPNTEDDPVAPDIPDVSEIPDNVLDVVPMDVILESVRAYTQQWLEDAGIDTLSERLQPLCESIYAGIENVVSEHLSSVQTVNEDTFAELESLIVEKLAEFNLPL